MATLYIEEFANVCSITGLPQEPSAATQTVTISGASAQSAAFGAATRYVRLHSDVSMSYLFGANPTATTSKPRLAAGVTEYFGVVAGQKVAAITNT